MKSIFFANWEITGAWVVVVVAAQRQYHANVSLLVPFKTTELIGIHLRKFGKSSLSVEADGNNGKGQLRHVEFFADSVAATKTPIL